MRQYGIRSVLDHKIRQHQIINHQMIDPHERGCACNSRKIYESQPKRNVPQYGSKCVVDRKNSGDIKSSIIKCVILVIQIHN